MASSTTFHTTINFKDIPGREPDGDPSEDLNLSPHLEHDELEVDQNDPVSLYAITPNDLIRDTTISPNCRWLIMFLLSNKPGWVIKISQIVNHCKGFLGRDKVRNLMNEAIEAGYIKRNKILRNNLLSYSYTVASTKKFKKFLRCTGFQGPEIRAPENQEPKEVLSEEILSIRNNTSLKVPTEPAPKAAPFPKEAKQKPAKEISEDARQLGDQMKNAIKQTAPHIKLDFKEDLYISCDNLIKKSGWHYNELYAVLLKGLKNDFWRPHLLKANPAHYLCFKDRYITIREQYDKAPALRKFAPSSTRKGELEVAAKMMQGAL